MKKMKRNGVPVLSFFTGGGFMDMGFIEAGYNIVWTNEHDPVFSQLYSEGITSWKNSRGKKGQFKITNTTSIKLLDNKEIIKQAFNSTEVKVFGMIGGPPCQDFSINGNLHGFKGERGSLTDTFIKKITEIKPAFFVMENVTGLLRVKKNADHFVKLLNVLKQKYMVDHIILNSLDYGVPQFRERVFVIGINRSIYDTTNIILDENDRWFPVPTNNKFKNAVHKYPWPGVNTFESEISKPKNIPMKICVKSCLIEEKSEYRIPNANEYFQLKADGRKLRGISEGETNRPSFKRLHRYKYSPTACYGNNEVHLHPYLNRRLSVRETLNIQGVSKSYVLKTKGNLSKKFKMIGNGVPVPLAKVVATKLFRFLNTLPLKTKG